jgi:ribosomal protein S18 acetylase RimI-like enzyme
MAVEIVELRAESKDIGKVMKIAEAVGWGHFVGTPEQYYASVRERGGRLFVARRGVVVMGYAEVVTRPSVAWALPAGSAYVFATAVDPRHAKTGVAQELLAAVLARLGEEGYARTLADVRWDNAASLNLCTRVGARIVGPSPAAVLHAGGGQAHLRVELDYAA